jgi:cation diffusion facilitator family transporter
MTETHAQEKQRVAVFSLLASGCLAVVKFVAALASGSLGLLSEAFHSLMDFGATALTLLAIKVADRPADEDHHYGHAKAESVVALIETGMLFGVTAWVTYESLKRLLSGGHDVELSWWLFAIVVGSIIIDFNRARALRRTAAKTGSAALAADALHFTADMWSSMAVLAGLTLLWLGLPWADSAAALVVAVFVARAAWQLGKQTLDNLLDAAPAGATAAITETVEAFDGVLAVRQLRVRPAGPTLFVDLIVDVPRTMALARLDGLRKELAFAISKRFSNADSSVQMNPVELDSESAFDKVSLIAEQNDLRVHHLAVQLLQGRLAVSFDVEVPGHLPLSEAHDKITVLESDIRVGLGSDVEVEGHMEPIDARLLDGAEPARAVLNTIEASLRKWAKREPSLSDLHNIRIRSNAAGVFVHYHCRFAPELTISSVHAVTDRIEIGLMSDCTDVKRVVAHAEPVGQGKHWL